MFEEMISISIPESNYPALDRTEFLIERACVPQYVPTYCAEAGQLFAMLAEAVRRNTPPAESPGTH